MAIEFRHKRYYRVRGEDGTLTTFTSVINANALIGFKPAYRTSNPTKIEELVDSNQTLIVTFEFDTIEDEKAFKSAVDASWKAGGPFTGTGVEHFKTVWLYPDDSVSSTANFEF